MRILLKNQSLDKETVRANLAELKKIAKKYGSGFVASEIRDCIGRMPDRDDDGLPYKKGRGYELAADLYLQHLNKLIDDIEERSISPTVQEFEECVSALLWCLFRAEKYRKGVETCVQVGEDLVRRSCYRSNHVHLYLHLAERTAACIVQIAFQKMEEIERNFNLAKRSSRKFDSPPPEEPDPASIIDNTLIAYLRDLQQQVLQARTDLAGLSSKPVLPRGALKAGTGTEDIRRHLDFLGAFVDVTHSGKYLVFSAFADEERGFLHETLKMGSGLEYLREAARSYEEQGDIEKRLYLTNLSLWRFRKAYKLWCYIGSTQESDRVKKKITSQQAQHA